MTWYYLIVRRCHHRWAHALKIDAAIHVDHLNRIAWLSISISACRAAEILLLTSILIRSC